MRNEMRLERIDAAIELLERPAAKLPVGRFLMESYGEVSGESEEKQDKADILLIPLKCDTAGCIAGTMSLDPYFRRRGFVGEWNEDGQLFLTSSEGVMEGDDGWTRGVRELLDITEVETFALVMPSLNILDTKRLHTLARKYGDEDQYRIDNEDEYWGGESEEIVITQRRAVARLRALRKRYEND